VRHGDTSDESVLFIELDRSRLTNLDRSDFWKRTQPI